MEHFYSDNLKNKMMMNEDFTDVILATEDKEQTLN